MTALAQRNRRTGLTMALLAAAMVGLAFASVPLYRLFCQVTGFGGTPVRAEEAPGAVAGQVGVRFDANIEPALPWRFEPVQKTIRIQPGARTQILYRATNLTARATTGRAIFNVTPLKAGQYFSKIECFCFTEQTLRGGQSVDMPVVFYVDPRIREDETTRDIDEITLSYTFYPVESGG
jgi:cytochrome c oxidase assembly protein subunit 11